MSFMDERLTKNPEQLTSLGLDKGKYAWAQGEAHRRFARGGARESKQENASRLQRLRAFGRSSPCRVGSGQTMTRSSFQMETIARTEPFEYGDAVRPYVVSQLTGAYQSVPTFLDRQHQIENKEDAEAYLARLARLLPLCSIRKPSGVRHDAGLKVTPPDFLIERRAGNNCTPCAATAAG